MTFLLPFFCNKFVALQINSASFSQNTFPAQLSPADLCGVGTGTRPPHRGPLALPLLKCLRSRWTSHPPITKTQRQKATSELNDFQPPLWDLADQRGVREANREKDSRVEDIKREIKERERLASHSYSHCGPCRLNSYANRQLKVRRDNTKPT